MIVVDTNIISYFYLTSEFSELAAELYQKNPNWIAPLLWRSEFENVLSLLKLSQLSGYSAYDCEFVNLAQDLNTTLVTMDRKILKIFPETALSMGPWIHPRPR